MKECVQTLAPLPPTKLRKSFTSCGLSTCLIRIRSTNRFATFPRGLLPSWAPQDIVDEAASTVATRDPEGSAHTEWMRSGPDFYEYKMRLWEHVRWFFRPCLHRGFPLLQLLEARELPLEEHLADMASPSPAAAAAAAAAGASASSSADAAPATGGAVFTTTTVGKITFHAVVDHYQRVAGQTDSARRYAQRLGLAAARLLEERGVVAAMRQVLDSAASPGLQSALAAFQQSAASLGPEQVLGLEPVVSLARAMACAGSGCQLPSELTPAKVGALMGGLGWAAGACCFPQSLELPHSSPFGRLAARFAQAFLDVSKSLVHYGGCGTASEQLVTYVDSIKCLQLW